jgi:dienelactone hydrolase
MSIDTVPSGATAPTGAAPARRGRERAVFVAAVAVGLVHAVDDAVLHRQPGVPVGRHLVALLAVTVAAGVATAVFSRLRPGLRSAVALIAGALVVANGSLHVIHVAAVGMERSDLTGLLAAVAGLVLVGLGVVIPLRHRGEVPGTRRRRWLRRGVAVLVGLGVAVFAVQPLVVGIVQTHKFREAIGSPPSSFTSVEFDSADGLRLSGWYRSGSNGAAVVIVSSARGDRTKSVDHAELLARHGYGVLLYDARGTGLSEGDPNGWGWKWEHDVVGAVDFLQAQDGVDADRIGALGLSTGADVLIEAAAHDRDIRAVVADGSTGRSFADRPPGILSTVISAGMFTAGHLFGGTSPGEPLRDLVAEAAPTPILLVATDSIPLERVAGERYAEAGPSAVLWRLPGVTHTKAIAEVPEDYERRVVGHFDEALLEGSESVGGTP